MLFGMVAQGILLEPRCYRAADTRTIWRGCVHACMHACLQPCTQTSVRDRTRARLHVSRAARNKPRGVHGLAIANPQCGRRGKGTEREAQNGFAIANPQCGHNGSFLKGTLNRFAITIAPCGQRSEVVARNVFATGLASCACANVVDRGKRTCLCERCRPWVY